MCGIFGSIGVDKEYNLKAYESISHRGPDDEGIFEEYNLFLSNRRLSIIDLTDAGHQPMISSNGKHVIVLNGEIYNHIELRKQYLDGFAFRSTSDTETILECYAKYGESVIVNFKGIFAFSIYNIETKEIIIARDHLGVKPLYYYNDSSKFLFGSEIKSFIQVPGINLEISKDALFEYITFLWCPGEKTAFKNVYKLLPGHFVKFNINHLENIKFEKYYNLPIAKINKSLDEKTAIDLLEQKLLKALKSQLLSDVPVGFFLSGGLDSSLLVAMAKKINKEKTIQCFTIKTDNISSEGFEDDLFYAKKVAAYLDVKLEIVDANVDIVKDFDKMIWHLDEPQADTSPLNVMNICLKAKSMGYKVLIGGVGGDDLFSGYRRHQAVIKEKNIKILPLYFRKYLRKCSNLLRVNISFLRRMKKFLQQIDKTSVERIVGYFHWLNPEIVGSLFIERRFQQYSPDDYMKSVLKQTESSSDYLNQILYLEQRTFLVDHNLNYTDKMSMAVGVEARVPYLDLDLVEFASTLPISLKYKNGVTKYLLRKVAERYLPKEVIYRSKTGFGTPVRKWIINDLNENINEITKYNKESNFFKIFNENKINKLIKKNKKGSIDASYSILSLLSINSWLKQFVKCKMSSDKKEVCSNCVMDTSDSRIVFDENGVCDHCKDYHINVKPNWHTDEKGYQELKAIVEKIKISGKKNDFDCILGLSGGVDSSYMLHIAVKEFGLRPLVFHVDGGWNSEIAVNNIQVMIDKLGLDLYTEVINWEEMKDFQLAFFKSGVPHIDIPQDHAFVATLYHFAHKYNIKYILNGGNISTECVRNPMEWLYYGTDMAQLKDIMKQFSTVEMKTYPFSSIFRHKIYLRYIRGVKVVKMLNYRPYIKSEALELLEREYGWKPYPQKHFESRFTKFYEGFWLPERFGFDTRRVQYSSLILTGQMTREEALKKLEKPAYDPEKIEDEFNYIATKLGITSEELKKYFTMPKKFYWDYKNQESLFKMGAKFLKAIGVERSIKR